MILKNYLESLNMKPELVISRNIGDNMWDIEIFDTVYMVSGHYTFAEVCEEADILYRDIKEGFDREFQNQLAAYRAQTETYLN